MGKIMPLRITKSKNEEKNWLSHYEMAAKNPVFSRIYWKRIGEIVHILEI